MTDHHSFELSCCFPSFQVEAVRASLHLWIPFATIGKVLATFSRMFLLPFLFSLFSFPDTTNVLTPRRRWLLLFIVPITLVSVVSAVTRDDLFTWPSCT